MKKIISFFAASALALGLIGCSGDLHENDVQPLTLVGLARVGRADSDPNECVALNLDTPDGSEQSITFKYAVDTKIDGVAGNKLNLIDGWGKDSGIEVKIVPSTALKEDGTPTWAVDFGGKNDTPIYLAPGAEEYTDVFMRGGSITNPANIVFDGVVMNETYTLKVKYSAATNSVSCKLEGASADASAIKFVIDGTSKNFPATKKLANGKTKDLSYTMTKAGTTYTYSFVSVADETVSFNLTNDMAGAMGGTLGTTASDLALNETTVTKMNLVTKTGVEYKITVDASKGIAKSTIKYEVVDILKDAKVNGTFKYAENSYSDANTKCESGSLIFKAERSEISFYVERAAGGVFAKDSVATIKPGDSAVSMKYVTDTKDEFGEVTKTAVENATPLKISELAVGSYYQIDFAKDSSTASLEASVTLLPPVDVTGMYIMIWFNTEDGWSNSKFEPLVKDGTYAWHVEVTPDSEKSVDKVRFDLCNASADGGQDWSRRYGIKTSGGTITLGEKAGPFIPSQPDKRDYFEGKQKTYRFDFNGEGGLWVTVTEK